MAAVAARWSCDGFRRGYWPLGDFVACGLARASALQRAHPLPDGRRGSRPVTAGAFAGRRAPSGRPEPDFCMGPSSSCAGVRGTGSGSDICEPKGDGGLGEPSGGNPAVAQREDVRRSCRRATRLRGPRCAGRARPRNATRLPCKSRLPLPAQLCRPSNNERQTSRKFFRGASGRASRSPSRRFAASARGGRRSL